MSDLISGASHYGTSSEAETYFSQRLNTRDWDLATATDRTKALFMATRAIDRLNFEGDKYDADQELQFPRNDDTEVPVPIRVACYECALAYLQGVTLDQEIRNLGLQSTSFAGVRDTYFEGFVPEHIRAGIPSAEAWTYLRPYLRDPYHFHMSRV